MDDWLADRRVESPSTQALIDPATDTSWTYCELDSAVERLAERLAGHVNPGDWIALGAQPGAASVVFLHAAMRVGATVVPLDPEQPLDGGRLGRFSPALLVCDDTVSSPSEWTDRPCPVRSLDETTDVRSLEDDPTTEIPPVSWDPADPLVALFTSGTTGTPDLVELTVDNVLYSAIASAKRLNTREGDRWCSPLSLHHMGGLAPVYRAVLDGMTVLPTGTATTQIMQTLRTYEATAVSLVPVMLERLLDAGTLPASLRVVLLGGSPATPALLDRSRERSVPVYPTYGMTETASQIATATPEDSLDAPESVGKPVFSTTVTIVGDDGRPCAPGEAGEIVVSGPTVAPGYVDSAGFDRCDYGFRTGDRGYLDDAGRLYVGGRLDERINTGGETVDPTTVRRVLEDHPAVTDAAVVGLPDDRWGERVGALVDRRSDCTIETLQSFCADRLAAHEQPRTIVFGTIERTASGTIDREAVTAAIRRAQ